MNSKLITYIISLRWVDCIQEHMDTSNLSVVDSGFFGYDDYNMYIPLVCSSLAIYLIVCTDL